MTTIANNLTEIGLHDLAEIPVYGPVTVQYTGIPVAGIYKTPQPRKDPPTCSLGFTVAASVWWWWWLISLHLLGHPLKSIIKVIMRGPQERVIGWGSTARSV